TNTPRPRRTSTYPLCLRSSMTRATVFALMPRNPASSRMFGSAWSRGNPSLSMACLSCAVSCRRIGMGLRASTCRFMVIAIVYGSNSTLNSDSYLCTSLVVQWPWKRGTHHGPEDPHDVASAPRSRARQAPRRGRRQARQHHHSRHRQGEAAGGQGHGGGDRPGHRRGQDPRARGEARRPDPLRQVLRQRDQAGRRRIPHHEGRGHPRRPCALGRKVAMPKQLLFNEEARGGLKNVTAGANPMALQRGIEQAVATVVQELKDMSKATKDKKEITQVATIAANNDKTIGSLIAEAMEKVGKDGVITVEEAKAM